MFSPPANPTAKWKSLFFIDQQKPLLTVTVPGAGDTGMNEPVLSMVLVGDKQNPAIPRVERDVLGRHSWGFGSAEGEPGHQGKDDWGSVLWGTVG